MSVLAIKRSCWFFLSSSPHPSIPLAAISKPSQPTTRVGQPKSFGQPVGRASSASVCSASGRASGTSVCHSVGVPSAATRKLHDFNRRRLKEEGQDTTSKSRGGRRQGMRYHSRKRKVLKRRDETRQCRADLAMVDHLRNQEAGKGTLPCTPLLPNPSKHYHRNLLTTLLKPYFLSPSDNTSYLAYVVPCYCLLS